MYTVRIRVVPLPPVCYVRGFYGIVVPLDCHISDSGATHELFRADDKPFCCPRRQDCFMQRLGWTECFRVAQGWLSLFFCIFPSSNPVDRIVWPQRLWAYVIPRVEEPHGRKVSCRYGDLASHSMLSRDGYGLDDRGVGVRVPVVSRNFTSPCRPDLLWGSPNLLCSGYRG
jgi:hypothetical protein